MYFAEAEAASRLLGARSLAASTCAKAKDVSQEVGLYQCTHCQAVVEIVRGTKDFNCASCRQKLVRDYFTYAKAVSVAWLQSRTTGPLPRRLTALEEVEYRNRTIAHERQMLESIQADMQEREQNFGKDEVILLTRQTSTLFNVHCCSEDSVDSIAPAIAQPESHPNSEGVCKVCMDQKPDIVLRPCNHGGLCETCMRTMLSKGGQRSCPWCREPVQRVLKFDATSSTVVKARVLDV